MLTENEMLQRIRSGAYENHNILPNSPTEYRTSGEVSHELEKQFKEDLNRVYPITREKAREKAYELAWEYGHSSGMEQLFHEYGDLYDLIQLVVTEVVEDIPEVFRTTFEGDIFSRTSLEDGKTEYFLTVEIFGDEGDDISDSVALSSRLLEHAFTNRGITMDTEYSAKLPHNPHGGTLKITFKSKVVPFDRDFYDYFKRLYMTLLERGLELEEDTKDVSEFFDFAATLFNGAEGR